MAGEEERLCDELRSIEEVRRYASWVETLVIQYRQARRTLRYLKRIHGLCSFTGCFDYGYSPGSDGQLYCLEHKGRIDFRKLD